MATATDTPYIIVGAPVQRNQFDEGLQQVVAGTTIKARWKANGAIISVFVPDTLDLVSTADTLIRFRGAQLDKLAAG